MSNSSNTKKTLPIPYIESKAPFKSGKSVQLIFIFKCILCCICALVFLNGAINDFPSVNNRLTAFCLLLLSGYLVIHVRKNMNLLLIFGFTAFFNYSIAMGHYFNPDIGGLFTSLGKDYSSSIAVNVLMLFTLMLTILMPVRISESSGTNIFIKKENKNSIIVLGALFALIFIFLIGFQFPSAAGERSEISPIYEYSSIILIFGFYYCGENKKLQAFLLIVAALYVLPDLYYGGRVTIMQVAIVIFLMLFAYRTNIKQLLPWLVILFFCFSMLGMFRQHHDQYNIAMLIDALKKSSFANDTAISAYFTSLTFIKVKDYVSVSKQLELFTAFLKSIFIGANAVPNSKLPIFTSSYFTHCNGGVLPVYFYFYLGWLGIAIPAGIVAFFVKIINNLKKETGVYPKLLSVYIISSTPRWYLYTPLNLTRGVLLFSIAYFVINFMNKLLQGRMETV